ncbi:DEAD/DEAH box helicase [Candidatus Phytoplasma pini]|uniref:DEAD/DEAH family helicase n=1 Tax=Candidatus Phytoplasma pini TaxID=267362 RepID=A0A559KJ28_9MOLU|nr:DEAD/DEAH box helicase family protein [Candidatus Phytoplasma pini]TVY12131.1 DEAD/DEAH family helicase [Candidatus Phytoplasma pini]
MKNKKLSNLQKKFINDIFFKFKKNKSVLGIAPTGVGKTLMFSIIIKKFLEENKIKKILVISNRDIINKQNKEVFEKETNFKISTCLHDCKIKETNKQVIFGMIQTIKNDLSKIQNIIDNLKNKNNDLKILGLTATPKRSDGKSLKNIFKTNVAINILDAISENHLVNLSKDKAIVVELTLNEEEKKFYNSSLNNDSSIKLSSLVNTCKINKDIVHKYKQYCLERPTIIFCVNVNHVKTLESFFKKENIEVVSVIYKDTHSEKLKKLNDFKKGIYKVLINCNICIEGYDNPFISCIIVLRPAHSHLTFYQMLGRGLRNPSYNNQEEIKKKKDCLLIVCGYKDTIKKHLENIFNDKTYKKKKII